MRLGDWPSRGLLTLSETSEARTPSRKVVWAECSYSCNDWGPPTEFRNRLGVMVCGTEDHLLSQCCQRSEAFLG
jgi:hypothetical protein